MDIKCEVKNRAEITWYCYIGNFQFWFLCFVFTEYPYNQEERFQFLLFTFKTLSKYIHLKCFNKNRNRKNFYVSFTLLK